MYSIGYPLSLNGILNISSAEEKSFSNPLAWSMSSMNEFRKLITERLKSDLLLSFNSSFETAFSSLLISSTIVLF